MIYILGFNGNMGSRYKAILKYLKIECWGSDIGLTIRKSDIQLAKGFIIATPTNLHLKHIRQLLKYNKPILCEKPITTDYDKLEGLSTKYPQVKNLVTMVNQYRFLDCNGGKDSYYDYFKTGKDGLAWDCINIIGTAKNKIKLNNTSPVWKCVLNGSKLNIKDMDTAYISMIKSWLKSTSTNWDYTLKAHKKVKQWLIK